MEMTSGASLLSVEFFNDTTYLGHVSNMQTHRTNMLSLQKHFPVFYSILQGLSFPPSCKHTEEPLELLSEQSGPKLRSQAPYWSLLHVTNHSATSVRLPRVVPASPLSTPPRCLSERPQITSSSSCWTPGGAPLLLFSLITVIFYFCSNFSFASPVSSRRRRSRPPAVSQGTFFSVAPVYAD